MSAESKLELAQVRVGKTKLSYINNEQFKILSAKSLWEEQKKSIYFYTFNDHIKCLFNKRFKHFIRSMDYLYPQSFLIRWAFMQLYKSKNKDEAILFKNKFDFAINIFNTFDHNKGTIFILGKSVATVRLAEEKLAISFPNIHFVGRFGQRLQPKNLNTLLITIRKSSCNFLFVGLSRKALYIAENTDKLCSAIILYYREGLDIFSGKRQKPSLNFINKNVKNIFATIFLPWNWFKIIFIIYFYLKVKRLKNTTT